MEMSEQDSLAELLVQSRTAPEYTMGALTQRTGVPGDTLRSWERRYGFPAPARTGTNRRLYSERDIIAVRWLREQTARGQGVSEAVAMVRSRLAKMSSGVSEERPYSPSTMPRTSLEDALIAGRLDAAQDAWDNAVVALSPDAIGGTLILPAHSGIEQAALEGKASPVTLDQARAFLLRKATILLDHAGPDTGRTSFCIVTSDAVKDAVPATVLAASLARASFRVHAPFLIAGSLRTVEVLHHLQPDITIVVSGSSDDAATLARLIPGQRIYRWSPDFSTNHDPSPDMLPSPLAAVKSFFRGSH